jgi:endonuclease/exonuclease/phosphatase family metal-dependent hydrolase
MSPGPAFEKRSALWVSVEIGGRALQVINAHLSLRSRERLAQAGALCGENWISHQECLDPAILLGDFNAPPRSRSYRLMASRLLDAQLWNPAGEPQPTFHTRAPLLRLDHIFVSRSIDVMSAAPVRTKLSRVASDHFPLMASFQIAKPEADSSDASSQTEAAG